jgi:hypothetical protein
MERRTERKRKDKQATKVLTETQNTTANRLLTLPVFNFVLATLYRCDFFLLLTSCLLKATANH